MAAAVLALLTISRDVGRVEQSTLAPASARTVDGIAVRIAETVDGWEGV